MKVEIDILKELGVMEFLLAIEGSVFINDDDCFFFTIKRRTVLENFKMSIQGARQIREVIIPDFNQDDYDSREMFKWMVSMAIDLSSTVN